MRVSRRLLLPLIATVVCACGADPISYSEPVGIELKADADKVTNDTLSEEKGIKSEAGDPYTAFVIDARVALGGFDPSRIIVGGVMLSLAADSEGVLALGEIFDGEFVVLFEMENTNDTFMVASGDIGLSSAASVALAATFDSEGMSETNMGQLLAGDFKVVYRAPTNATYEFTNAKSKLQVTLTFEAFE